MGVADIIWMALILAASGWLLWHFLWRKQGSCPGCSQGDTTARKRVR